MRLIGHLITDYLWGLLGFIIIFYFVTANPNGSLHLVWNLPNLYLTSSYLIAYPLLMAWVPQLRTGKFKTKSLASHSSAIDLKLNPGNTTNPIANKYDIDFRNNLRDDRMNFAFYLLERTVLMAVATPVLLLVAGIKVARNF